MIVAASKLGLATSLVQSKVNGLISSQFHTFQPQTIPFQSSREKIQPASHLVDQSLALSSQSKSQSNITPIKPSPRNTGTHEGHVRTHRTATYEVITLERWKKSTRGMRDPHRVFTLDMVLWVYRDEQNLHFIPPTTPIHHSYILANTLISLFTVASVSSTISS